VVGLDMFGDMTSGERVDSDGDVGRDDMGDCMGDVVKMAPPGGRARGAAIIGEIWLYPTGEVL
jgi:hypothetical protein